MYESKLCGKTNRQQSQVEGTEHRIWKDIFYFRVRGTVSSLFEFLFPDFFSTDLIVMTLRIISISFLFSQQGNAFNVSIAAA